ncbi:enoyl-CoA hydratase-related protein [Tianweitania sediminis]|uniref:Enoyl-CoA hydratase/isomerase family protein n=1 Tax=Tianweitania sediminis TaxID=1502156 RepID=A0A8J7UJ55_9HYPH|nr:enoyl-CoA hydratase-related protein [Tianweitania sediminis]MBP0439653.1 enoyl-CoA hydratase/isomerase family protein [Tianweitania sediminis]
MDFQAEAEIAPIRVDAVNGVATLTIDRPAKKNAMTAAMWSALINALRDVAADASCRVLVLRGEGNDFCAGADIAEFDTVRRDPETARAYEDLNARAFGALRELPIPTIAAIRGNCLGGGLGLAISCDLRLATADARFSIPAAKLGLAYPAESIRHVVWAAGPQLARFLIHTGQQITAAEAHQGGLLLDVVKSDHLDERVAALAATIAANAPLTHRASKRAINAVLADDEAMLEEAAAMGAATFASEDYAEGRRAFRERRQPVFRGR